MEFGAKSVVKESEFVESSIKRGGRADCGTEGKIRHGRQVDIQCFSVVIKSSLSTKTHHLQKTQNKAFASQFSANQIFKGVTVTDCGSSRFRFLVLLYGNASMTIANSELPI